MRSRVEFPQEGKPLNFAEGFPFPNPPASLSNAM
jgi:hypothetical protein